MTYPSADTARLRRHAFEIWKAGVEAVQPEQCMADALGDHDLRDRGVHPGAWHEYERIWVVGGGKAGAAMARYLDAQLVAIQAISGKVRGWVNVPAETVIPLTTIHLHPARPAATNQPTAEAVAGTEAILRMVESAGPNDLMICLLSGGGSALLPAPVEGVSLADKQAVTRLLNDCGATIGEMNAVRKHLSRIKGGGLIRRFRGRRILSLIISDVIRDPLDVIASGPTCADPTTFAEALAVLERYQLVDRVPDSVLVHLRKGLAGEAPETLKDWDHGQAEVHNLIIANNERALRASTIAAQKRVDEAYAVTSALDGDTRAIAELVAQIARANKERLGDGTSRCVLSGGETTVKLPEGHGLGGRNQEFVLAFLNRLGREGMEGITVLSGGTDGEDGPTDAAGAIGDAELLAEAERRGLNPADYLARHDSYHFFEPLGGLLKTGLTHTNVMDLRVILIWRGVPSRTILQTRL